MKRYITLKAETLEELEEIINKKYQEGFILVSGIGYNSKEHYCVMIFMQDINAMLLNSPATSYNSMTRN